MDGEIKRFATLTHLTIELRRGKGGYILNTKWDGVSVRSESINGMLRMAEALTDTPQEEIQSEDLGGSSAISMGHAYSAVRQKYSGLRYRIHPESRYWKFIVEAARLADEAGIDHTTWCEAITDKLTQMSRDNKVTVPWPSQLTGEKAIHAASDYTAGAKANTSVAGARKAKTASGIPLAQDEEYQAIRNRMKRKMHTVEDMAYMEARQREIYGAPKDWLANFKKTAKGAK